MRKSKFSEEQIVGILREAEGDTPVKDGEICQMQQETLWERAVFVA